MLKRSREDDELVDREPSAFSSCSKGGRFVCSAGAERDLLFLKRAWS